MAVGTTALLVAGGAFSAATQILGSQQQAKAIKGKAAYDSAVYEQQAEVIKEQKKISDYQYNRQAARARGEIVSKTAGKGLLLSGSPLAILADTESQMMFDKAISDYNLSVESNYATSAARFARSSGAVNARLAAYGGYGNALSTMLNTGATIGMLNLKNNPGKL